jgi:hypothetical protein
MFPLPICLEVDKALVYTLYIGSTCMGKSFEELIKIHLTSTTLEIDVLVMEDHVSRYISE